MATFAFKALDLAGMPSKGEMDAGDKQAVAAQLRGRGLIVIDIEEQVPANAGDILARFQRVKADELVIATRQLATMVNSGMSLLRSLYVIEEQTENNKLRDIFVDVRKDVEAGLSLSDSLRKHPDMFNDLYVAMVQAGETGGILDNTLLRVADQLEKDAALRRQIKAAMMYPSLIGGFAFVVLFALVAFLVPVFEKIFKDFGGELPAITKFTVFLSHMVTQRWYVMIAVVFGDRVDLQEVEAVQARRAAVGSPQAEVPDEDRWHRPEGRPGALLAHLLGPDRGRRADARGHRDHGQDLGQQGRRKRDA